MHRHAGPCRFVGDVVAQLEERPGMPLVAMCALNRCSLSDTAQVFEGDCLAQYSGFLDELLADAVVGIALEAGLTLPHASYPPLGVAGADLLEPLAAQVVAGADDVNESASEVFALTIRGEIGDAQIDPQCAAVWLYFAWHFAALGDVQVVRAVAPDEISPTDFPGRVDQHLMLARAEQQPTDDTALQSIERHPIQAHQAVGTRVVADAATRPEGGAGLRIGLAFLGFDRLDGFNGFGPGADRQLSAQAEPFASLTIDAVMRGVGDAFIPAHPRNPCCGGIEGALCRGECRVMAVNVQLATDCASECFAHTDSIADGRASVKWKGEWRFLPMPEGRGLRAGYLMNIKQARDVARQWVIEEASSLPGFHGAYYAGSTNWLPDDAPLPATSDVDVMIVLADANPPTKLGKFIYRDALLEASYLSRDRLRSPDLVLGDYHLAGGFRTPSVILDPSGELADLQAAVSKDFAKRRWVYKRCEQARDKTLRGYQLDEAEPLHDQVIAWLFPAGITTHVLLVAGLKNPTVRRRYAAVRELLMEYDHTEFFEPLLELLGCARMSRARVEQHLSALASAFDVAKAVIKTPFPFASDISDIARPIAIDGSRELIEHGFHREAIFWMVATYSRCQNIFSQDAPEETRERLGKGYQRLLGDIGITSFADLQPRSEQVKSLLPHVWEVTETILAANPGIEE
jgi:hypothetical protein